MKKPGFDMDDKNQLPTEEEIASCAYLIWEQEGQPDGFHQIHWSNAENQLMACNAHEQWSQPD